MAVVVVVVVAAAAATAAVVVVVVVVVLVVVVVVVVVVLLVADTKSSPIRYAGVLLGGNDFVIRWEALGRLRGAAGRLLVGC